MILLPCSVKPKKNEISVAKKCSQKEVELGVANAQFCVLPRSDSRKEKKKKKDVCVEGDAARHPFPMACLRAAEPRSCGNDPQKNGQQPPSLCCRVGERSTTRARNWGGGGWNGNWRWNFCALRAGRGPRGRRGKEKARGQGWAETHRARELGCGVFWMRGAVRTRVERRANAQKMPPGTQNPGGGWGGGGLLAPGPPVARGPLTCQQEGASGRRAHPACPPTLSRPSTRVSQLPPPGQLHSWPG